MKKSLILIILFLFFTAVLPFFINTKKLTTDITVLLPDDPWILAHVNFLRDSQIGSITAISTRSETPETSLKMIKFADKFANLIKNEPTVKEVYYKFDPDLLTGAAAFLFNRESQILKSKDLMQIKNMLQKDKIAYLLKEHYNNLIRPGGIFLQKIIKSDPLNFHKLIINKIEKNGKDSGFKFILKDNGLWSEDGKSFLILVYSNVAVTDPVKGEEYLEMIEKKLQQSIPNSNYSYTIISGHRHAIENQRILKRDIAITLTVAGIGFLLLFMIFFKDWKAIFVFIIPIIGILSAIGLTIIFFKKPSAIILGLGSTVIGISLDYGIHVFVSIKNSENKHNVLRNILRPLIFSALTTLGVFWAFFFSETPGYHQMAFISTCGIAISLILSITFLPLLIKPSKEIKKFSAGLRLPNSFPEFSQTSARITTTLWAFLMILSIAASFKINFQSDIREMDASQKILKKDQDKFAAIWGENSQAAISVIDDDLESAMEKHDKIAEFAEKRKIPGYQSLSLIWPSQKTRKKNFYNWKKFWSTERINNLRTKLKEKGALYDFSEKAFDPFFKKLKTSKLDGDFFKQKGFNLLSRKFVNRSHNKVIVNSFFKDKKDFVNMLKNFTSSIKGVNVISPKSFGDYISKKILEDSYYIASIAIILVVLLAWICLKNPYDTFKALIPVFSALLSIIPFYFIFKWKINAITFVSMIVVSGLAIDYGIFSVSSIKNKKLGFSRNAFKALTISMLSTIIGSGALLFAEHPALKTVGKVITIGVISAYFTAILTIPAIATIKKRDKLK